MLDAWEDLYIDVDHMNLAFQVWFTGRVAASQNTKNAIDPNDPTHVAEGLLNYNQGEDTDAPGAVPLRRQHVLTDSNGFC